MGLFDLSDGSWNVLIDGVDAGVDNTIINDGWAIGSQLIFGTKDLEFATKKQDFIFIMAHLMNLSNFDPTKSAAMEKALLTDDQGRHRLLDIDSPTRQLVSYPIDLKTGQLGDAEVVIDFTGDPAVPDGAVLTPDGTGIVAMFRPEVAEFGETRLYDLQTGNLLTTWQTMGSPQNTCPAFVRVDGKLKLLITTAVEHMSDEGAASMP